MRLMKIKQIVGNVLLRRNCTTVTNIMLHDPDEINKSYSVMEHKIISLI